MPVIDTHVHYNLEPLSQEWKLHWQKAQSQGVSSSLVVGADLENSKLAVEIAQQEQNLKAAVGIHPHEAENIDLESSISEIKKLANQDQVIAIGEIGLDYFQLGRQDQDHFQQVIALQKELFTAQLQIAIELNLPVSIHVRDRKIKEQPTPNNAYWDTLDVLKNNFLNKSQHPNWILHCASGSKAYIQEAAQLGAYFGIDGNITYNSADDLRSLVELMPTNKILVETDAPYLPPIPHRGKTCEPWMVTLTAQFLESKMGIKTDQIWENTHQIFPELN